MKLRTKLTLITTLIVIVSINISTILIANFAKQNITAKQSDLPKGKYNCGVVF